MDPFSQAGLGAVVAQAAGHRQLGYRAAAFGALAGALPDIDVLFSIGGDFVDQLVTHRGITHSLLFAPVVGPLLGWLIWRRERRGLPDPGLTDSTGLERRNRWMLVITLALWSHPLLDLLTPYGTQLLLPFSNARFAINAMPIIDPIYTAVLGAGLLLAGWAGRRARYASGWRNPAGIALGTLLLSCSYLGYGWLQNLRAESAAYDQLAARGLTPARVAAFPTILQVHLRRVVARLPDADLVGFYSTYSPCEIAWSRAPRAPQAALGPFLATREGAVFDWFTMGWANYVIVETGSHRRLIANDLRYGVDADPAASIFSMTAPVDAAGTPLAIPTAGRNISVRDDTLLAALIERAYAPACRLLTRPARPPSAAARGANSQHFTHNAREPAVGTGD